MSLAEYSAGKKGDVTKKIGRELMSRIRAMMPALPVPLVASCILSADNPISRASLEKSAAARVKAMRARGVHVGLLDDDAAHEVSVAVSHLLMRRMITETDEGIRMNPDDRTLLEYYAGSISHHA